MHPSRRSRQLSPQPRAFPPNPNVGDKYVAPDGREFEWNGTTWVLTGSGGGGALTDPTTTKGDLIVRPSPTPAALARMPVGANNDVLTADSTATLGIAWKPGGASFVHPQAVAAAHWIVNHSLNFQFVSVLTVSTTGDWIIGDVAWTNANRVDINFSKAVSGTAVVRK